MRLLRNFLIVAAIMFGLTVATSAADNEATDSAGTTKELTPQTNCPVMGGKIDSTLYTDIQGQRVYHCCSMCSAKLKADPDTYFKKAAEKGVLFENIQATCPVSGKKLESKTVYTDYQGRRVYFCCQGCIGKLDADPQTYLKKLDEGAGAAGDTKMNMNMDHHSGDQGSSGH
jgi:YHS domain-containing protein